VPAKLATRVRVLSIGHGRKSDDADAVSVGIAALSSPTLNAAHIDTPATALRALTTDLVSEVRQLDRRIAKAANDIQTALTASGTALTDLYGIGTSTAAKILAHVGDVGRFRSTAAFATYTGTAPIEVSSGEVIRHRLSRAGNRQLNYCLQVMADCRSTENRF
jgi:transposase